MTPYPVTFSIERPLRFDRAQLALRIVALLVISWIGLSLGVFFVLLYVLLPLIAAAFISQRGPARFLSEDGPRLSRAIGWVVAIYAYFALLTDRLPVEGAEPAARYAVTPAATPTVGRALARIVFSLPLAVILALLSCIAWIVWILAAVMILLTASYPAWLYDFQCGVVRWLARLLAYHASLVDRYPPLSFHAGAAPSPAG